MTDDRKPDPIEDVRAGLGLLFRAAKSTVEKLPLKDIEQAVENGAREVGEALESVGRTIERDVFGVKRDAAAPPVGGTRADAAETPAKPDEPKPGA